MTVAQNCLAFCWRATTNPTVVWPRYYEMPAISIDGRHFVSSAANLSIRSKCKILPERVAWPIQSIRYLRHSQVKRLVDVRDNKVASVFSGVRRSSGWTAPNSALAKRIAADLSMLGNAVLVGVSNDVRRHPGYRSPTGRPYWLSKSPQFPIGSFSFPRYRRANC